MGRGPRAVLIWIRVERFPSGRTASSPFMATFWRCVRKSWSGCCFGISEDGCISEVRETNMQISVKDVSR